MNKQNDSNPILWDAKNVLIGCLYNFSEPVEVPSDTFTGKTAKKKVCVDDDTIRTFKTGRLSHVDENKAYFTGHKVPQNGAKKSNRKYVFGLPIPQ